MKELNFNEDIDSSFSQGFLDSLDQAKRDHLSCDPSYQENGNSLLDDLDDPKVNSSDFLIIGKNGKRIKNPSRKTIVLARSSIEDLFPSSEDLLTKGDEYIDEGETPEDYADQDEAPEDDADEDEAIEIGEETDQGTTNEHLLACTLLHGHREHEIRYSSQLTRRKIRALAEMDELAEIQLPKRTSLKEARA